VKVLVIPLQHNLVSAPADFVTEWRNIPPGSGYTAIYSSAFLLSSVFQGFSPSLRAPRLRGEDLLFPITRVHPITLLSSITSIHSGHSGQSAQFGKWVIW
jgi:hypothetical protein